MVLSVDYVLSRLTLIIIFNYTRKCNLYCTQQSLSQWCIVNYTLFEYSFPSYTSSLQFFLLCSLIWLFCQFLWFHCGGVRGIAQPSRCKLSKLISIISTKDIIKLDCHRRQIHVMHVMQKKVQSQQVKGKNMPKAIILVILYRILCASLL